MSSKQAGTGGRPSVGRMTVDEALRQGARYARTANERRDEEGYALTVAAVLEGLRERLDDPEVTVALQRRAAWHRENGWAGVAHRLESLASLLSPGWLAPREGAEPRG